ncbi:MAG: 30S ribosomal protein S9 [Spirochaetes bacterium]|nr:30S ribosomal protein S9 [Spirochaetota bacterium]
MAKQLEIFVGKRKTAIARVRIANGSGKIVVNDRPAREYFNGRETILKGIAMPMIVTSTDDKIDVIAVIRGGGIHAQGDALRHGISRALLSRDAANRPSLKKNGFLTRDSREVERKKYGHKGARRSFQFSKR